MVILKPYSFYGQKFSITRKYQQKFLVVFKTLNMKLMPNKNNKPLGIFTYRYLSTYTEKYLITTLRNINLKLHDFHLCPITSIK